MRHAPTWLVLALALAACHRAAVPDAAEAAADAAGLRARDFYPLAAGNRWVWQIREPGAPSGWKTPHVTERTVEITGQQDGFWRDTGGGALRVDAWGLRDRDRYLLREPVTAGTKWSNVISLQSTERYEILEAGRPCTVKAGTYGQCVVVRGTNAIDARRTLSSEWTFAQGVGIVRLRTSVVAQGAAPLPQMEMELVSFRPAP